MKRTVPRHSLHVPLRDRSQVGEARRRAVGLAESLSFDPSTRGRLALVVTEAATNLLQHAGGGSILLSTPAARRDAIEVLALDRGPGIGNLDRAMTDGFTTADSQGEGLGAIRRQADDLDIYSRVGEGTALMARLRDEASTASGVGSLCLPLEGERVSGDAIAVRRTEDFVLVLLADGVGHGPAAAEAAERAVGVVEDAGAAVAAVAPERILDRAHAALDGTRGAAVAVARIALDDLAVRFAGIGNVQAMLHEAQDRTGLVSHNGTIGWGRVRIGGFDYQMNRETLLVMHSDGVSSRWDFDAYPGLREHDPSLVAGVLYRDHGRENDDSSIVVFRPPPVAAHRAGELS